MPLLLPAALFGPGLLASLLDGPFPSGGCRGEPTSF